MGRFDSLVDGVLGLGEGQRLECEAHDLARRLGDGPPPAPRGLAHRMGPGAAQLHEPPRAAHPRQSARDARRAGARARSATARAPRPRGLPAVHRRRADALRRRDARGDALARDAREAGAQPDGRDAARSLRRARQRSGMDRRVARRPAGGRVEAARRDDAGRGGVGRAVRAAAGARPDGAAAGDVRADRAGAADLRRRRRGGRARAGAVGQNQAFGRVLPSSIFASELRCTSSGPSAKRSVRASV